MMGKKRVIKGSFIEIIVFGLVGLFEFLKIKYFIQFAGSAFNGYYTFIEQLMGYLFLAEASLSAGIIFTLYKPVASNNHKKISALYRGGKRIYGFVTLAMAAILLCIMALVPFIVHDHSQLFEVELTIVLIGISNLLGYLFYSRMFLCLSSAYQKKYVHYLVSSIVKIFSIIVMIIFVAKFKSLILLGFVILFSRIIQEFLFYFLTMKQYSFLDLSENTDMSPAKMVGDLFVHQIGSLFVKSVDSVIIMIVKGPAMVSIYNSYHYIMFFLSSVFSKISSNVVHLFGHMFVKNNEEKILKSFKLYVLFCVFVANFFAINFYVGIPSFVRIWIGRSDYVLSNLVISLFASGLFLTISYAPMITAISANGLFKESKYFSFISSFVNLVLSIILVNFMGLAGILLATVISYFVSTFFRSKLIGRKVFIKTNQYYWFGLYFISYVLFLGQLLIINLIFKGFVINTDDVVTWLIKMIIFSLSYLLILALTLLIFYKDFRKLLISKFRIGSR